MSNTNASRSSKNSNRNNQQSTIATDNRHRDNANNSDSNMISSCKLCDNPDNIHMVQCDKCDDWFHFICVNVTAEISNCDWICNTCSSAKETPVTVSTEQATTSSTTNVKATMDNATKNKSTFSDKRSIVSGSKSSSSVSSEKRRLNLKLSMLEEKRKLQEARDKEYLKQKYYLLEQYESDDGSVDNIDNRNKEVADWLYKPNENCETIESTIRYNDPIVENSATVTQLGHNESAGVYTGLAKNQSTTNVTLTRTSVGNTLTKQILPSSSTMPYNHHVHDANLQYRPTQYFQQPVVTPMVSNINCAPTVSSNRAFYQSQPLYQPISTSIPRQRMNNDVFFDINNTAPAVQLTSQQIAARHVMSKDLPYFSGKAEDWPLFISSFELSSRTCGFSNAENLIRLQNSLKGKALEAVRNRLLLPDNVPDVIANLKLLFGRPELIIHTMLKKIRNEPPPKNEKLESLISFAMSVQNMCAIMQSSDLQAHLSSPILIQELVDKLPASLKLDWAFYKARFANVTLATLSEWLSRLAYAASEVTWSADTLQPSEGKSKDRNNKKGFLNTHSANIKNESPASMSTSQPDESSSCNKCSLCGNNCRHLEECDKFISLSYNDRWKWVKENLHCRTCLRKHSKSKCKRVKECGTNSCTFKHHKLLHNDKKTVTTNNKASASTLLKSNDICLHQRKNNDMIFRIVPVVLHGNNIDVSTYAFLDDGSSLTLMNEALAEQLNLEGTCEPICLKWTSNMQRVEHDSKRVSMKISSASTNNSKSYSLNNVRTIKSLQLPVQSLNVNELCKAYTYLKDLPIQSYQNAVPQILIGIDNLKVQVPLKIREGSDSEHIIAAKTRLGWSVYGSFSRLTETRLPFSPYQNLHVCECDINPDEKLHEIVKQYFSLDRCQVNTYLESNDEKQARQIMETTTVRNENRFETGLLWKYNEINLPNSLPMARHRLQSLIARMAKDEQLSRTLMNLMEDYVKKGYARKLSPEELQIPSTRIWYLPVFPVANVNKPNKIRIVWDGAAKVNGVSLNSVLHKGPDLLVSLISVLFKFREKKVAICGDIREMYHQISIRKEDQHSQRFLWPNKDTTKPADVYIMQVMTFGSSCSPSCAQFVKNRNAVEFQNDYPRAVSAILNNHYVDDWLDSMDNEKDVIDVATHVKQIHEHAGFEIRNWLSNSSNVLNALGVNSFAGSMKSLNMSSEVEAEKVLGMWWCTSNDKLTFSLKRNKTNQNLLTGEKRPSKREVLKIMMTIFDPLGLLASFMVYVKILLQEIWCLGISWDDAIPDNQFEKWLKWIKMLPSIENVQINRCYFSSQTPNSTIQLHIFVDSSEQAYAAVAYLRCVTEKQVECALVAAKTRVAPIKPLSIPRLELEAALLGAKLAQTIDSGHSLQITQRYFWSDSKCVLSWLSKPKKLQTVCIVSCWGNIGDDKCSGMAMDSVEIERSG